MSRWTSGIVVAVIAALALGALYELLLLQYEAGDGFPEYSSYRADPLGLRVLHDALASVQGQSPRRNLGPIERAQFSPDATLLLAGAGVSKDEVSTLKRLEAFADAGGRVVILFRPYSSEPFMLGEEKRKKEKEEERKKKRTDAKAGRKSDEKGDAEPDDAQKEMMEKLVPMADISERWGFHYEFKSLPTDAKNRHIADANRTETAPPALPERLPWHSGVAFTNLAPEWAPIYLRAGRPVVIERAWGAGRIALVTDNYLVSNEAMTKDRAPAFLAWLTGQGRPLIFEETHLGVARATGLMRLMQQYRLVPMLAAGVVLVLLFIWRNAASLVPKRAAPRRESAGERAHTAVGGIASLARRAIGRGELLDACWKQYRTAASLAPRLAESRRAAIEEVLAQYRNAPPRRADAPTAFNRIVEIANERKPPL